MSSKYSMEFGQQHGDAYAAVIEKWGKKLVGVKAVSKDMQKAWAADLRKALEDDIVAGITQTAGDWKKVGPLDPELVKRFARETTQVSLTRDTNDLLRRLHLMAQEPDTFLPAEDSLTAAIKISQALKRVGQTLAQIFDMARDRFNQVVANFFVRSGHLTGRRMWNTGGGKSRHSELSGQTRSEGENFDYKGDSVYGPRPSGGSPAKWSNCSCYLKFERKDGEWVSIS